MLESNSVMNLALRALRRMERLGYTQLALRETQGDLMPETGMSIAEEKDSATRSAPQDLAEPDTAPPVAGAASAEAEAWHEYVGDNQDRLHEEMVEAREILHKGTASDALEIANRDVRQEAYEAAARWQTGAHA